MTDIVLCKSLKRTRAHLRAVAYRMLGSFSEADDAVQEGWIRLNNSDAKLSRLSIECFLPYEKLLTLVEQLAQHAVCWPQSP